MSANERVRAIGRALRHRNYRLFFFGQGISLIGTWLTRVATGWLVYRLTGSALLLGVVSFASQIPMFVLGPLAGVYVDRSNRHRVLVQTQVLAMVQSGLLAWFALRGTIDTAHVIVLNVFQGLINAFDMPARQAFLIEMVDDRADLANAVALNSSMVNAARLLGPSVAGVLIASVGEGGCFLIDSLSYVAVIASLLAMRVAREAAPRSTETVGEQLRAGVRYVRDFTAMRAVLSLLALVSVLGMPYNVLMPLIASRVLHGGASTLAWLTAASGLGALCGALYLASRQSVLGLGRIIATMAMVLGVGLVGLGAAHGVLLAAAFSLICGTAMMVQMAGSNTVIQTIADPDKRGRVMSFFSMAVFGTTPLGSLLAGALADRIGAARTLALCGAGCFAGGIVFTRALPALREQVRPIYVRLGILPEVAEGIQSATQNTTNS